MNYWKLNEEDNDAIVHHISVDHDMGQLSKYIQCIVKGKSTFSVLINETDDWL